MSTLPRNVQAQIDEATAIQEALNKPAENPAPAAAPVADPEAPAVADQQPPAKTDPAPAARNDGADYWEQRFKVMQGKYNAEVPALQQEVTRLTSELAKAQQPAGNAVQRAVSDLTPEEIENYGPDLVALIQRVAGGQVAAANPAELETIKTELEGLKQKTQQSEQEKAAQAQEEFFRQLIQRIPDAIAINALPAFHEWLSHMDTFSGKERQQLLIEAQTANDAYRVAALFQAFKDAQPATADGASAPAPVPEKPANTIPEEDIQPRSTRSNPAPPAEGKWWSNEEINQFYKDVALGKRYTKAEAAAIEQDISDAVANGRISR
ncbi:hypothetical protein JBE38_13720 [Pseudomonas sp. ICBG1301]|uniref:hypothetical protein n=1 Tax=Pseudomonas sp. ICBG1301 TaxID=2795987 RepID=UPI001962E989|nr:hypothetical protein [Pseudomonas sp. ICBG1301]MBM9486985.1 hypothetical protein [Pseudomonas sp. ICBG1301]